MGCGALMDKDVEPVHNRFEKSVGRLRDELNGTYFPIKALEVIH